VIKNALFLLLIGSACTQADPLEINPSEPPALSTMEAEQGRVNLIHAKLDKLVRAEALVNEVDKTLKDTLPLIQALMNDISTWQNDLFEIAQKIKVVESMTDAEDQEFRTDLTLVMSEFYDLFERRYGIVKTMAYADGILLQTADFQRGWFVDADFRDYRLSDKDIWGEFANHKAELRVAINNIDSSLSIVFFDKLNAVVLATRDIIENVLVIRALDFPELSEQLEELKQSVLVTIYLEPNLEELRQYKDLVSMRVEQKRLFSAQNLLFKMDARITAMIAELPEQNLPQDNKDSIPSIYQQEYSEAENYMPARNLWGALISNRHQSIKRLEEVCLDHDHINRYKIDCGPMLGLLGIDDDVLLLSEEKLKYLEYKMDVVLKYKD
jgi:hypothetical protein